MGLVLVYITAPTAEEAQRIGDILVQERLAACINIIPEIQSTYWWENKIERAKEVVIIAKTKQEAVDRLIKRVKEVHSYQVPCIIAFQILAGNPDFLNWIRAEVK